MGLDISFYENATPLPAHERTDCYDEDNHVAAYIWPDQQFQRTQHEVHDGCYQVSGRTADWGMSYGGYSRFRELLLATIRPGLQISMVWALPHQYEDLPLVELLNFADNEGTIGPKVCAKIAAELHAVSREQFAVDEPDRLHWLQRLDQLTACFATVGDTGLADFR